MHTYQQLCVCLSLTLNTRSSTDAPTAVLFKVSLNKLCSHTHTYTHTHVHTPLLLLGMNPEMSHGVWGHNNSVSILLSPLSVFHIFPDAVLSCFHSFSLSLFLPLPSLEALLSHPETVVVYKASEQGWELFLFCICLILMTALQPVIHTSVPPFSSISSSPPFLFQPTFCSIFPKLCSFSTSCPSIPPSFPSSPLDRCCVVSHCLT